MKPATKGMKIPWDVASSTFTLLLLLLCLGYFQICSAQDYGGGEDAPAAPPPEMDTCNGIFLSYSFDSREKEYPHLKNATAQSWAFKSALTILNAGTTELKAWQAYIGFQHDEVLVSTDGAMVMDGESFPIKVGKNGTRLTGYPRSDLKTAIDTAGDWEQMSARVEIKGTMFGVRPSATPMPRTIRLENEGFKCPGPTKHKSYMYVCCKKDPKYKVKKKNKFLPRQHGDLSFTYDVLQSFEGHYLAQVTIDNNHPLGRLDHWNLTFEWMRNEFIYDMRGAYTHRKDAAECLYSPAGQFYKDFDFSKVMNCQRKPTIADLPPTMENDDRIGKLPQCCRNGTILPKIMNETKSQSIFQMTVYKLPPDMNRTALTPPQNWKIEGVVNPHYKCGPPIRVDPSEFPDPMGLDATVSAIASFQVTCNITKPKPKAAKCCVSFSAYYTDSVIPCNTCACGCEDENPKKCDVNAKSLLLPAEALLVPFENRTEKARAWAKIKHLHLPKKLPCPDNCGVSLNWHVDTDYKTGWTARLTIFNWDGFPFEDWFAAIEMKKAFIGYENVYSFNGTKLTKPKNTIFMKGLPGLNYLVPITNGTRLGEPRVPGKQQSVISFLKKNTPNIDVPKGDGFPTRVIFNGEECALPTRLPQRKNPNGSSRSRLGLLPALVVALLTFVAIGFH